MMRRLFLAVGFTLAAAFPGTGSQLLQNATTGFILVPANATGKATGVPVGAGTGAVPMTVDPTPEVCFYVGGAWKCAALS